MKDIYITWEDYHKKIEQLAKKIHEDNLQFNQIICIAKGGLRVGDVFSRLFNVHPYLILSSRVCHLCISRLSIIAASLQVSNA